MSESQEETPRRGAAESGAVRRALGPVSDHTLAEIMALNPTMEDVEVALAYLEGSGEEPDRAGHPLTGTPGRIVGTLQRDDVYRGASAPEDG
ncbi:MAG: hypothetical protein NXI21_10995 [Alphaproteobacteria bacterium]|nr:hypothetical protein [Alphaproteobacteria bacterium]